MLFCFRFHKPFSVTARFFLDEGFNQGDPLYPNAAGEHSVKKGIGIESFFRVGIRVYNALIFIYDENVSDLKGLPVGEWVLLGFRPNQSGDESRGSIQSLDSRKVESCSRV